MDDDRLTDPRLVRRHEYIRGLAIKKPSVGFPEMMGDEAALEACYRFFDNPRVTLDALLAPHFEATVEAASKLQQILLLHDSSWIAFGGQSEREGMGRVGRGKKNEGFLGHFSLACSADGLRNPLGLLAVTTHVFDGPLKKQTPSQSLKDPTRKSLRWGDSVAVAERRVAGRVRCIHVMDREADDYGLFEQFAVAGRAYVVRLRHDRKVQTEEDHRAQHLRSVLSQKPCLLERDVPLSPRALKTFGTRPNPKVYPPRLSRKAKLRVHATRVLLPKPKYRADCTTAALALNIVYVVEADPPEGEAPIDWLLVTSEAIDNANAVEAVVDAYRARWLVEEYFMALKTGCAYEQRQLESLPRLENALGILAPVAVGLLRLRHIGTEQTTASARSVLSAVQLKALRHLSRRPLPHELTAEQAVFAVAALAGHLKRNGRPGWRLLHRGYAQVVAAADVWEAARRDQ
jgi:hypothetical protein